MPAPNAYTPAELEQWAAGYQHDNHMPGDPGYCLASKADWTVQTLSPAHFNHIFGTPEAALTWLQAEIAMDKADEMHREWGKLLLEPIREEVFVLMRDNTAHIWDGFHRIAAAVATGQSIQAIVGHPRPIEQETPSRATCPTN